MTPVEIIAITPAHLRGPWHPMPACPFALSQVVYPPQARWLMRAGADGRYGPWMQFVPLLAAMALYRSVDLEFEASGEQST